MATVAAVRTEQHFSDRLLINGALVAGAGKAFNVLNPSSGEVTANLTGASSAQFEEAIDAARKSYDSGQWSDLSTSRRIAILEGFHDRLVARSAQLRSLIVTETGCPVGSFAIGAQVDGPLAQIQALLNLYPTLPEIEDNPLTLDERVNPVGGFVQSLRRYVPVGVVAAISAYNFPLHISLWKIFPALLAGNSLVLRPSPLTPLSGLLLGEIAAETELPAGVLNILAEADADGALAMTTHRSVDMVTFTGSSAVGAKVAAQASPSMKRLQLELGGKSAQIFLPDRIEAAFSAAVIVCMSHAGQGCVLGTRVFVPEADKAKVLGAMKASLAHAKIGDSDDPATTMGPVICEAQAQRCERYVQQAVEAGATIVAGGRRADRPGFFFEPTILDVPDNRNPAAQDEIFGPVICVIGYRDIDHAIEMANDSPLGLSGYVHGKDARQALAVAKRLRTGTVNVNAFMSSANASSGGHKMSGVGRERGVEGIRAFQEIQVMNLGSAS